MANIFTVQTLLDTQKRTVLKLTGKFDGSGQEGPNTKISASNLAFALDTNGRIAAGNANSTYLQTYHTTIQKIQASIAAPSTGAYVELYWRASGNNQISNVANSTIATFGLGYTDLEWGADQVRLIDPTAVANATGDIGLTTFGFAANCAYTFIIDLKKTVGGRQGVDYDQGQSADPTAFNTGQRSPYGTPAGNSYN